MIINLLMFSEEHYLRIANERTDVLGVTHTIKASATQTERELEDQTSGQLWWLIWLLWGSLMIENLICGITNIANKISFRFERMSVSFNTERNHIIIDKPVKKSPPDFEKTGENLFIMPIPPLSKQL